jgi:protein-S-isoprenylcysteine O-methyltransferase
MLANPISTIGFAYFSYRFFAERIPHEEAVLSSDEFFGERYRKYKAQTPTYIPFIS